MEYIEIVTLGIENSAFRNISNSQLIELFDNSSIKKNYLLKKLFKFKDFTLKSNNLEMY